MVYTHRPDMIFEGKRPGKPCKAVHLKFKVIFHDVGKHFEANPWELTAKLGAIDPPKVRLCALASGVKKRLKPPSQGRVPDNLHVLARAEQRGRR